MKRNLFASLAVCGALLAPNLASATGTLTKAVGINTLASAKLASSGTSKSSTPSTLAPTAKKTVTGGTPIVLGPKVAPTKTETIFQPVIQPVIQPINRVIQPVVSTVVQPVISTSIAPPIFTTPTVLAPKFVGASFAPSFRFGGSDDGFSSIPTGTRFGGQSNFGRYANLGKVCGMDGGFGNFGGGFGNFGGGFGNFGGGFGNFGGGFGNFGGGFGNFGGGFGNFGGGFGNFGGGFGNFGRGFGNFGRGFGNFGSAAAFGGQGGGFLGSLFGSFGGSANPIAAILGGKLGSQAFSFSISYTIDGVRYELDLSARVSASFAGSSASPNRVSQR